MQIEIDGVVTADSGDAEQGELYSTFTLEETAEELETTFSELQSRLRDESTGTPKREVGTEQSGIQSEPASEHTSLHH
jgi:hypothetical protein